MVMLSVREYWADSLCYDQKAPGLSLKTVKPGEEVDTGSYLCLLDFHSTHIVLILIKTKKHFEPYYP